MNWRKVLRKCLFYLTPSDWRPLPLQTIVANQYKIEKVLGVGGYGYAYFVTDIQSSKKYTLKQIKKHILYFYKKEELLQEGQLLSGKVQNLFPIPLNDFFWNKHVFIVFPYVKGTPIDTLVFQHQVVFTEEEALCWFQKAIHKVKMLHDANILHNDLRLPNFLIDEHEVNIIDFGLAEEVIFPNQEALNHEFFHLGHFLLFLLYSSYKPKPHQKEQSWEEELQIKEKTKGLLRKLLLLEEPFQSIEEIQLFLEQP